MKRLKVGLNGFGRIGRSFARIALKRDTFDIVLINTRKTPSSILAYLLQYDSIYRKFEKNVQAVDEDLVINGKKIVTNQAATPEEISWDKYGVDVVIDATGAFLTKEELIKHIKGTVKKVIVTAPTKDETTAHVVMGVNDNQNLLQSETVISNASCTTNCASPMFKVINDDFRIISGFLTTAHAYTLTQSLLDDAGKSFDRSRAAPLNLVPSTTGAAQAVVKVLPQLKGKIDGLAVRIPVPTVSFTDISAVVEKPTTVTEVNLAFRNASESALKNILAYETNLLVSSDYIGSPYSCVYDANYTKVINGNFVKVFGWYDNEWGYSTRLVDLIEKLANLL